MRKKMLVVVCTLLIVILGTVPAFADGIAFSDDFSSGSFSKWSNPTIDNVAGVEDAATKGVATIANGVMELDNASSNGSFFYIGLKDIKTLDFTITMKVRVDKYNDGWLGVSFRKDFNDRYNACNNNFIALRVQSDNMISLQGYRGYSGSAVMLNNRVSGGYNKDDVDGWLTWKIDVNGSTWQSYVNGELLGEWYYTKNLNEGFISINACTFDGAVDDVVVTGNYTVVTKPTEAPTDAPTAAPADQPTGAPAPTSAPTRAPANVPTNPPAPTNATDSQPTAAPDGETEIIRSLYQDVIIDKDASVIELEMPLKCSDFLSSFALGDGYTLRLLDAEGNEVTDGERMVENTMLAAVNQGTVPVVEFAIETKAAEPAAPTAEPAPVDSNYIRSIYKDVTIDKVFSVIQLDTALKKEDFISSFKLSDGYRLVLKDASGAEVTDAETMVTDTMTAVVYRDSEQVKEFTLTVNEIPDDKPAATAKPTKEPNKGGDQNQSTGFPLWLGIVVSAVAVLALGAVVVMLLLRKKGK